MRTKAWLAPIATVGLTLAAGSQAHADDATAPEPGPQKLEVGIFGGAFISNYYHQFYDEDSPNAPDYTVHTMGDRENIELNRANLDLGITFAYFFHKNLGIEAEAGGIFSSTKKTDDSVKIFQLGGSLVAQLPMRVTPFVDLGITAMITRSDFLGNDVDAPLHAGGGIRFYATKNLAIRLEARFLRGPSSKDPFTLDASYGEFRGGLSYAFGGGWEHKVLPPPPDPDPDHDGILGDADRCPQEAEDKDGYQDEDGCPDTDNDADGLLDINDRCPMDPEDKDGYQDDDGCPEADNDQDGIPDTQDKCPTDAAEDKDGYADDDGCPDYDNDGDGISDPNDKCPNEPETKNSYQDGDGCPDTIPDQVKKFTGVIQGINFRTNSAELLKTSFRQLDKAVEVMKQFPDMQVEIQGHTDDQAIKKSKKNKYETNLELSQARAESVTAYLVSKGIDGKRLVSKGYGDTVPVVAPTGLKGGKLTTARAKNRRVEFKLITQE